jgi:hypothetical protein
MITSCGQASSTTRATNLKDAMLNLPLHMRPLNGEAVTYRLEPDEPSPYLAVPSGCLLQFEEQRFGLLRGCHSSCDT